MLEPSDQDYKVSFFGEVALIYSNHTFKLQHFDPKERQPAIFIVDVKVSFHQVSKLLWVVPVAMIENHLNIKRSTLVDNFFCFRRSLWLLIYHP